MSKLRSRLWGNVKWDVQVLVVDIDSDGLWVDIQVPGGAVSRVYKGEILRIVSTSNLTFTKKEDKS